VRTKTKTKTAWTKRVPKIEVDDPVRYFWVKLQPNEVYLAQVWKEVDEHAGCQIAGWVSLVDHYEKVSCSFTQDDVRRWGPEVKLPMALLE